MKLEEQFGQAFMEYVCLVQKYAEQRNPVHLCFAPVGTNMMMLSSEICINVKMRRRTVIVEGAYKFDQNQISEFNLLQGTDHKVLPWVMQRFDGHDNDPDPWTIWFRGLGDNEIECEEFASRAAELEATIAAIRPHIDEPQRIELGVCADYVSRLNASSEALVKSRVRVSETGCVGVHIRRGDAGGEDESNADPGRRRFSIESYIKEMEACFDRGYREFYLLTESQLEIDRITEHFADRCRIITQALDRKQFPTLVSNKQGKENFIEYQCLENPQLIKFAMESAIVDLENAARCEAIIGSFESAFSNLAYLKSVGRNRRRVEHTDLAAAKFGAGVFYPNLDEKRGTSLFVIKERDVGFFSMYLQVVNTLLHLHKTPGHWLPYVNFTDKQEYFSGSETWEDFFEPLVHLNPAAVKPYLDEVDRNFEKHMPEMKLWDRYGVIYSIARNLSWSGSYYPKLRISKTLSRLPLKSTFKSHRVLEKIYKRLTGQSVTAVNNDLPKGAAEYQISHIVVPDEAQRRAASVLVNNYINLKPEIKRKVEELFGPYNDHYVIGVQFRGTDARKDERRMVPGYDLYIDEINRHLEARDPADTRQVFIFVASDEQEFITFLGNHFDNVGHFNALRHQGDGEEEKSSGKLGWGMPAFIRANRKMALEGAILDYAGLCRSHFMIHNFGSLTNAVLLTRPEIGSLLIGDDYRQAQSRASG